MCRHVMSREKTEPIVEGRGPSFLSSSIRLTLHIHSVGQLWCTVSSHFCPYLLYSEISHKLDHYPIHCLYPGFGIILFEERCDKLSMHVVIARAITKNIRCITNKSIMQDRIPTNNSKTEERNEESEEHEVKGINRK